MSHPEHTSSVRTDRDQPAVRKPVDTDSFYATLARLGAHHGPTVPPDTGHGVYGPDWLRAYATAFRKLNDTSDPARPWKIGHALDELATAMEQRPLVDSDHLVIPARHRVQLRMWARRCRRRSELLHPFVVALSELADSPDPRFGSARRARDLLDDADAVMPGVAEALRPMLDCYAG